MACAVALVYHIHTLVELTVTFSVCCALMGFDILYCTFTFLKGLGTYKNFQPSLTYINILLTFFNLHKSTSFFNLQYINVLLTEIKLVIPKYVELRLLMHM